MEEFKDLEAWVGAIKKSGSLIIVEGKKDRASLQETGIECEIVELSSKALFEVIEYVADRAKQVIILTDLDKEGKRLYSILRRGLLERGVYVDKTFREWLFKKTKLRQIEGIHL